MKNGKNFSIQQSRENFPFSCSLFHIPPFILRNMRTYVKDSTEVEIEKGSSSSKEF